jgi:RNA polymerase sigma-70 factor (ECF subfamily)
MTPEEFNIQVMPMRDKLYRLAKRLLDNDAEAEDAVQETLIRLWSKRDELATYRSVDALSLTITKNLCLDILKSPRRNQGGRIDDSRLQVSTTPYRVVEAGDTYSKIMTILGSLPADQKTAVQLRDVEGYEFEEIAEILETTVNNVRVCLSRARKKIREMMIKSYDYEYQGS